MSIFYLHSQCISVKYIQMSHVNLHLQWLYEFMLYSCTMIVCAWVCGHKDSADDLSHYINRYANVIYTRHCIIYMYLYEIFLSFIMFKAATVSFTMWFAFRIVPYRSFFVTRNIITPPSIRNWTEICTFLFNFPLHSVEETTHVKMQGLCSKTIHGATKVVLN